MLLLFGCKERKYTLQKSVIHVTFVLQTEPEGAVDLQGGSSGAFCLKKQYRKRAINLLLIALCLVIRLGFEPRTPTLKVLCSQGI